MRQGLQARASLGGPDSPWLTKVRPWPAAQRLPARVQATPAELFERAQVGRRPSQLTPLSAPGVLQRMKDPEEASERAVEFGKLWSEEWKVIGKLNEVLAKLSRDLDVELQKTAVQLALEAREVTKKINLRHAAIVVEYEKAEANVRKAFVQALFPNLKENFGKGQFEPEIEDKPTYDVDWVQSLFDRLLDQTVANEGEEIYRYRYLAYSLQSLGDEVGVNQIRHLVHLLGERKLVVAEGVSYDMSAGPVKFEEKALGTKLDEGGKEDDEELMKEVDGNLFLFLQQKYSKFDRKPNLKTAEIGNVQVNLDKENKLFPIFPGIANEHVFLFTTPKFASVHHENGHIISFLEGKAALGNEHKYKSALASLSDQEEAFNIFGGQRSDRAYLEFLKLPVRFDHKTLIQYLDSSQGWDDWAQIVWDSWRKTYKDSPKGLTVAQKGVVKCLERIVSASWSEHTKKVWTPKGVKAIRSAMAEFKTAPEKIVAAQKAASVAVGRESKNRDKVTQEFYELVNGLAAADFGNLTQNLSSLGAVLKKI